MTPHAPIQFNGQEYQFLKERRNETRIYRASDGGSFLRVGNSGIIAEELRFHRTLLEQGYPVPAILTVGLFETGDAYFCESSAGDTHFGELFAQDILAGGSIRETAFDSFLRVVTQYVHAQAGRVEDGQAWESVFLAVHAPKLIEELPEQEGDIMSLWQKIQDDLMSTPFVLCHGDFNPFNILPGGVVDFETAFCGPLGYDLVSATSSIFWFPRQGDAECLAGYGYTPEQLRLLFALASDARKAFDALFVLRSIWLVVGMHRWPKLQAWRYAKFQELMQRYLLGESLYSWVYGEETGVDS